MCSQNATCRRIVLDNGALFFDSCPVIKQPEVARLEVRESDQQLAYTESGICVENRFKTRWTYMEARNSAGPHGRRSKHNGKSLGFFCIATCITVGSMSKVKALSEISLLEAVK